MGLEGTILERFTRNIGLLTEEEQRRLLECRVGVAGAGGVGGLHILALARLGVGKFTIADPDVFEAVNINRQFGAMESTFGKNKAAVLREMVLEINPEADVRIFPEGVSAETVDAFLEGVDVFVDGIDFFEISIRRILFRSCRERGIFGLTAAPLGFGATLQVFSPDGMSFDDYFGTTDDADDTTNIAAFASGLTPHPYHIKYMDLSKASFAKKTGPAVSPACTLASSLIATEVVKILTGKGRVRVVPHYLQFDMLRGKFRMGTVWFGGKNPLQLLMKRLILWKAKRQMKEGM